MIKDNVKLKKYNISIDELAKLSGYTSTNSFLSSKKRDRNIQLVENIINTVEEYIIDQLKK